MVLIFFELLRMTMRGLFSHWLTCFIECTSFTDCKGCADDWPLNRCSNFPYTEESAIPANIHDWFRSILGFTWPRRDSQRDINLLSRENIFFVHALKKTIHYSIRKDTKSILVLSPRFLNSWRKFPYVLR